MAKQTESKSKEFKKISRHGVHSKAKTSNLKSSKNYVKKNRGQGK